MPNLKDKESLLLDFISKKSSISQRELARKTGISLGLINVILKRLIKAGYLRASQLNKRKLEYLLTPQGFIETAKKTYDYTINTIRSYKMLEANLSKLLKDLHRSGYDYFSIHGDGELRDLTVSTFQRCLEDAPVTLGREPKKDPRAVVLNITTDSLESKGEVVNVWERIGEIRNQD